MDTALRPLPHGEVKEIAEVDWLLFAEHVVMFVHMEDEVRGGKRSFVESLNPILKGFMVLLHNLVHWPSCPMKQVVEPVEGIVEEAEVVQVYVQNGSHRLNPIFDSSPRLGTSRSPGRSPASGGMCL
jgi:hypothetical protein